MGPDPPPNFLFFLPLGWQRCTCYMFPEIHIWCYTCRIFGIQHVHTYILLLCNFVGLWVAVSRWNHSNLVKAVLKVISASSGLTQLSIETADIHHGQ